MGVGGMNSLTLTTVETQKYRQDSMHRTRYRPTHTCIDDIGHEFDAMTSPKGCHGARSKRHRTCMT